MFGTIGAAFGTIDEQHAGQRLRRLAADAAGFGDPLRARHGPWRRTGPIIRSLFRFGLPTGVQGIAMNIGGVFLLRFIGSLEHSAAAQAAYRGRLHRALLADHVDVDRPDGRAGDDRRAEPGRRQSGSRRRRACTSRRASASRVAAVVGAVFLLIPGYLLAVFGMTDPLVLSHRPRSCCDISSVSGSLHHGCAELHRRPAGDRRHAQSALHLDHFADCDPARSLHDDRSDARLAPGDIWMAIVLGHVTRCVLSVARFRQQKWRTIAVDIEPARP